MALQGGHRFAVDMDDVFLHGVYAMGVEQAMDYDEKTGRRSPAKDKVTGELVWTVTVMDRDPEARVKEVKVKVTGPYCPVLPGEIAPGTGLHACAFEGLTVTPYIVDGPVGRRSKLGYSFRATKVIAQGKAPAATATQTGNSRGGGQAPAGGSGDGKAA